MILRLLARIFRRHDAWVRLTLEGGGTKLLGPMSRYTAEVYVVMRIAPSGSWDGRRGVGSRSPRPISHSAGSSHSA